jgi:hypothetical protein
MERNVRALCEPPAMPQTSFMRREGPLAAKILTKIENAGGLGGSGSDKVREGLVNSAWAVHT